jgi:transposase-like protein
MAIKKDTLDEFLSPDLISTVTDAVLEMVAECQNRPLEVTYPLMFFNALCVKIRDEGLVRNKAVYVALGVTPEGTKDILGLWIETSEGAKFWLRFMNQLKNRGVGDILIAVVDGLKGFPDAINAAFPQAIASWKNRKPIAAELKKSIARKMPTPAKRLSMRLTLRPRVRNIRQSRRVGGDTGSKSFRFLLFLPRSAA